MDTSQVQSKMASNLIAAVVGQPQQAQTDLAMKLAKISLQQSLQSPPGTADASGQGGLVDVMG